MRIASLIAGSCVAAAVGAGGPVSAEREPGRERPAAWGTPADGLQAGIRPAARPQRVAAGTVLEFEVVVRNVQSRGTVTLALPPVWYSGREAKGVVSLSPGGGPGSATAGAALAPGAEVLVGRVFLGLPGSRPNAGHLIELPAGTYRVGSEGVLPPPEFVTGAGALPPGSRVGPRLRTGYLDVELPPAG